MFSNLIRSGSTCFSAIVGNFALLTVYELLSTVNVIVSSKVMAAILNASKVKDSERVYCLRLVLGR